MTDTGQSLARLCFIMVGILLGAVVTPETLRGVADLAAERRDPRRGRGICMMAATAGYLRLVHRWDPLSALLGASPGSMAQVMALSAEFGADVRGIAIVHVMRVLLIVLGLPAGLALFGSTVEAVVSTAGATGSSLGELAVLVAVSTVDRARHVTRRISRRPDVRRAWPAPGSCMAWIWSMSRCPGGPASAAMLTLGAVAGTRFANTGPRMLLSYLGAAFGSFAVAAAVAASFALLVVAVLPFRVADVIVAFAPGAQDTMMVLALATAPRPGLCRRASSCAVSGRELLGGRGGATPRAPPTRAIARRLEAAGAGDVRRLRAQRAFRHPIHMRRARRRTCFTRPPAHGP